MRAMKRERKKEKEEPPPRMLQDLVDKRSYTLQ